MKKIAGCSLDVASSIIGNNVFIEIDDVIIGQSHFGDNVITGINVALIKDTPDIIARPPDYQIQ